MRTKQMLMNGFEEIKKLQQYLYMNKDNFIEITNIINVKLRIRMDEDLNYYCLNMNFPDVPEARWSEEMTNETMLAIIEQLKKAPAIEFPERFKNRWDEIHNICCMNLSLNH